MWPTSYLSCCHRGGSVVRGFSQTQLVYPPPEIVICLCSAFRPPHLSRSARNMTLYQRNPQNRGGVSRTRFLGVSRWRSVRPSLRRLQTLKLDTQLGCFGQMLVNRNVEGYRVTFRRVGRCKWMSAGVIDRGRFGCLLQIGGEIRGCLANVK